MFFESNRSSRDGMVAVGTVVMNRLKSGRHGDTICGVVGEKGQFAPGVMTRRMNSKAMPDVQEAAEAVLKGERSPKLKNAMFFHTAGLKFPYKNMHYVLVAGGNAFYEKRGRNWKPLPDDSMVAFGGATPDARPAAEPVMVASAVPTARPGQPGSAKAEATPSTVAEQTAVAAADLPAARPAKQRRLPSAAAVVEAATAAEPDIRTGKRLVVPANAPVPTARAAFVTVAARKPARQAAPAVQMAIEEPIAARFGRSETPDVEEAVLSFDAAQ
jgi:spore germination cell wall hydrolase CwlJ-like protein